MSKVYICDVCTNIKQLFKLNELTRTYHCTTFSGSRQKKTETIHICSDCWDRIKKEQRSEIDENALKDIEKL